MPEHEPRLSPGEEKLLAEHKDIVETQIPDRITGRTGKVLRRYEQRRQESDALVMAVELYAHEGKAELFDRVDPATLEIPSDLKGSFSAQIIQYEYPAGGGRRELGRKKEENREFVRDFPESTHEVQLTLPSQDGEEVMTIPAVLSEIGYTSQDGGVEGFTDQHARFTITDSEALRQLKGLVWYRTGENATGTYGLIKGELGGLDLEVFGKPIRIEVIRRLTVDFDHEGEPIKATLHDISWSKKSDIDT